MCDRKTCPRSSLGHTDVSTTMIYIHVLNRGGRGVNNPSLIAYDELILS